MTESIREKNMCFGEAAFFQEYFVYFNKKLQSKGAYFAANAERRLGGVC